MELVPKPGTKSVVWDYFAVKRSPTGAIVDNGKATCRACRKQVMTRHGNTSNLLAHLRTHHGRLYSEVTSAMKGKKRRQSDSESRDP